MSLVGDKREVLDLIGTYDVLGDLPDLNRFRDDALNSVKSKSKNLLGFMVDLLVILTPPKGYVKDKLKGKVNINNPIDFNNNLPSFFNNEEAGDRFNISTSLPEGGPIADLLNYILKDTDRLNRILKEGLVVGIKSGFVCGVNFNIPNPAPEITVGIDKIDFSKLLVVDRNGIGGLYFGSETRDFNTFLYDTVKNKETDNIWNDITGQPVIEASYVVSGNEPKIKLKIPDSRVGTSFFDWLNDYINSTEIVNYKGMMAEIAEFKSGAVSFSNNFGSDIIMDKLRFDEVNSKIMDTGGVFSTSVQSNDDSFFTFTNEETVRMEERANELSRGSNLIDLGCGLVEVVFNPEDLQPLLVLGDDVTPQKRNEAITNTINSMSNTSATQANPNDVSAGVGNYLKSLLLGLPNILTRFMVTPKVVGLIQLVSKTINNKVVEVVSSYDFSRALGTFFKYVTIRILGIILEYLFIKIKEIIINKIKQIIVSVIREKVQLYVNSIKSTIQSKMNTLQSGLESGATDLAKSIYK